MHVDRAELLLPASAGARVIALKFLSAAHDAAPGVLDGDSDGALHDFRVAVRRLRSWIRAFGDELDGAIKDKHRRRLKRIADATNPGRDLQVQLEWVARASNTGGERRRAAARWLARYLRASHDDARGELRAAVERDFPKVYDALSDRLSSFDGGSATAELTAPTLIAAIGDRVEPFVLALASALDGVHTVNDDRAAHKARIRAKRLRYLLEPASDEQPDAADLVSRLKGVQDKLGRVHDGHVMSRAMRDALECAAVADARRAGASALGRDLVHDDDDARAGLLRRVPRAGLLSLMRHLRADLDAAFVEAHAEWAGGALDALTAQALVLAEGLRQLRSQV